jgi:hypothetical protein
MGTEASAVRDAGAGIKLDRGWGPRVNVVCERE